MTQKISEFPTEDPVTNRGSQSAVVHNEKEHKNPDEIRSNDDFDLNRAEGGTASIKTRPKKWSENNYDLVIDWFECTFLGEVKEDPETGIRELIKPLHILDVFRHFGLDPLSEDFNNLATGVNKYNFTFVYKEKIKFMIKTEGVIDVTKGLEQIFQCYNRNMGVHMMLSGYACREWEKEFHWFDLIQYCIDVDANISRIDVAWDVFSPQYISLGRIIESVRKSNLTCRSKTALLCDEIYIASGEISGQSVRFGSSSSTMMLMIYDKLKERASASYEVTGVKHWIRLELRLRRDTAYNFIREVTEENFGKKSCEVLNAYIQFRERSGNDQKTRWPIEPWWEKFLNVADQLRLSNKAIQTSIQKKFRWIDMSVTKTVAQCLLSFNPDDLYGFQLQQWLWEGVQKIEHSDLKAINTFRVAQGGSVISQKDLEEIKERLLSVNW